MKQFHTNLLYVILGIIISLVVKAATMPTHFLFSTLIAIVLYCLYHIVISDYIRTKDDALAETAFITMIVPLIVLCVGSFGIVSFLNYIGAVKFPNPMAYYVIGWPTVMVILFVLSLIHTIFFNYIKTK